MISIAAATMYISHFRSPTFPRNKLCNRNQVINLFRPYLWNMQMSLWYAVWHDGHSLLLHSLQPKDVSFRVSLTPTLHWWHCPFEYPKTTRLTFSWPSGRTLSGIWYCSGTGPGRLQLLNPLISSCITDDINCMIKWLWSFFRQRAIELFPIDRVHDVCIYHYAVQHI